MVRAAQDYFCPLFGPGKGVEALKMAKIDLVLVKFSNKGGVATPATLPLNPPISGVLAFAKRGNSSVLPRERTHSCLPYKSISIRSYPIKKA